ncbi:hypothetical protein MCOR02_001530 [Pyricularia oryzae]|nr:hypothetical protein MCOR02_001530 [Pyricularia oryzae]
MSTQVDLSTIPISPDGENAPTSSGDKEVTVFHDSNNFNVKHPLMHKWTLWFTKPPTGKGDNWAELLKEVITFNSVEEFWGIYVSGWLYFFRECGRKREQRQGLDTQHPTEGVCCTSVY